MLVEKWLMVDIRKSNAVFVENGVSECNNDDFVHKQSVCLHAWWLDTEHY